MTSQVTAVEELASDLGSEVYVLAPNDSHYFLGEAAMFGVATALVTAFLRGMASGVESQVEGWGRSCGEWLTARVASVVRSGTSAHEAEAELITEAQRVVDNDPDEYRDAMILVLGRVLREQGMTHGEATDTARRVAEAAESVLAAVKSG